MYRIEHLHKGFNGKLEWYDTGSWGSKEAQFATVEQLNRTAIPRGEMYRAVPL